MTESVVCFSLPSLSFFAAFIEWEEWWYLYGGCGNYNNSYVRDIYEDFFITCCHSLYRFGLPIQPHIPPRSNVLLLPPPFVRNDWNLWVRLVCSRFSVRLACGLCVPSTLCFLPLCESSFCIELHGFKCAIFVSGVGGNGVHRCATDSVVAPL